MTQRKSINWFRPNTVGTLHCQEALQSLTSHLPGIDVLELRLDCLMAKGVALPKPEELTEWPLPVIVTARADDEGGLVPFDPATRHRLLADYAQHASAVDLECRHLHEMKETVDAILSSGCQWIASHHDFTSVPSPETIQELIGSVGPFRPGCLKLAATTNSPEELAQLISLTTSLRTFGPFASMGMGSLGKISRLVLASLGSSLNYGWLGRPQVDGQWEARLFTRILQQCEGDSSPNPSSRTAQRFRNEKV